MASLKIAKNGVRAVRSFTEREQLSVLKFFEFAEQKKEIVVMVAPKALSCEATEISVEI